MTVEIPSIAGAADAVLEKSGPREGADKGDPQTSVRVLYDEGSVEVGIWECTPGGWPIVNRGDTEMITIVSGKGVLTDADGAERHLGPGVAVVMPKGWSGRWDISETVRKIYVVAS